MSFDARTGDMQWPDKLVWSDSLEVQLILADIPLIALGVLGLASAMLLMVTGRLSRYAYRALSEAQANIRSREAAILIISMLFAFSTGFFNLLSLLLGEDTTAVMEGMGQLSLGILSEICDGWLASTQLFFLFSRMLQLMRQDREDCESMAIGFYASEKDVFGVAVKCKVYEVLSGRLVGYVVYGYLALITALDIVWRHLLLDDRKATFKSLYLASDALQFVFLVAVSAMIVYEVLRCKKDGRIAYAWLALTAGLVVDIALKVTGFAILAFTITPLARLLTAVSMYIWLLDLLVHDIKRELPPSSVSSLAGTPDNEDPPPRDRSPSLKQLRLLVTSPFRVDTPMRTHRSSKQLGQLETRSANLDIHSQHRRTLSFGPVIRRSSKMPSWLGMSNRRNSTGSDTAILTTDPEQQAGRQRLTADSLSHAAAALQHRSEGNPAISKPTALPRREAPSSIYSTDLNRGTGTVLRSKRAPSVSSTTGTYNDRGIRLDSPIEVPMGFGTSSDTSSNSSPVITKAKPSFSGAATPLPTMNEDSESVTEDFQLEDGEQEADPGRVAVDRPPYYSIQDSTPSQNPSVFSRESGVSLSYFPRPSSPSMASERGSIQAGGNTHERRHRSSIMGVMFEFDPPRMPVVQSHLHQLSWQSNDTFTGSSDGLAAPTPPIQGRGFNVTSFIGDSAGPDITFTEHDASGGAKILRASSLSRQSAKLLRRSDPSRKYEQIESLAPPARVDSLKNAVNRGSPRRTSSAGSKETSQETRPYIARHASSNAAAVKEIIDDY